MLTTTFKKLHEAGACTGRYRFLAKGLGGITKYGKDTPIPLIKLLEINGSDDALWALRACEPEAERDKLARLFACDCAERVLHICESKYPDDKRPRNAIETARRFAEGKATKEEMAAAWDAAGVAAGVAAWDAARDAARAAAWVAARDAAWDAARAAAWDAARDAARAAAWDAAWDARDAAGAAEQDWQLQHLKELLAKSG